MDVFVGKSAARDTRDSHGFKVSRTDHVKVDQGIWVVGLWPRLGMKVIPSAVDREWHRVRNRNRRDPGYGLHPPAQLGQKLSRALGRVAVELRINVHDQDAARTKANVDIGSALEAAQKESGCTKQHHRGCDLRNDEKAPQIPSSYRTSQNFFSLECLGERRT